MTYNSIKAKEHYQKNKNKIKLQQIEYLSRPGKREHKCKKNREWVKNHPEKIKVYSKKSYEKHKEERELRRRQKRRDDNLIKNGGLPKCLQGEDNFYKKWTEYYIVLLSYCVIIRNWYIKLYQDESISMNQIEKITGYTHLHRTFKTYKIQIPIFRKERWHSYQHQNHCKLSQEAIEWINGELLGDGCLQSRRNKISANFSYASKHFEYIDYISYTLKRFGIEQAGKIRNTNGWNNEYPNSGYSYRSRYYIDLEPIRKQWYPEGKKIVPKDIKLTPLTCRQWYIGDGCLAQGEDRSSRIHLSTQGFTKSDNELLVSKLIDLGFKATVVTHKGSYIDKLGSKIIKTYYYLYVPCCSTKDFLNYIGKCPVSCYQYKWNYMENKRKSIKYEIICKQCGKKFEVTPCHRNRKYCSKECCRLAKKAVIYKMVCEYCGKDFERPSNGKNQKCCSYECMGKMRIDKYSGTNNPNYRHGKYVKL